MVVRTPIFWAVAIRVIGCEVRCVMGTGAGSGSSPHVTGWVSGVDTVGHAVHVWWIPVMSVHGRRRWAKAWWLLMLRDKKKEIR